MVVTGGVRPVGSMGRGGGGGRGGGRGGGGYQVSYALCISRMTRKTIVDNIMS